MTCNQRPKNSCSITIRILGMIGYSIDLQDPALIMNPNNLHCECIDFHGRCGLKVIRGIPNRYTTDVANKANARERHRPAGLHLGGKGHGH